MIPAKTRRGYFPPVLEVLIKRLRKGEITFSQITILMAGGIRPAHTVQELKQLVGERIFRSIKIIKQEARARDQLIFLGKTSFGTKVELNKAVGEVEKLSLVE